MFEALYSKDEIQLGPNMKKCLGNDCINTGGYGSLFSSSGLKPTLSQNTAIFDTAALFYERFSAFFYLLSYSTAICLVTEVLLFCVSTR